MRIYVGNLFYSTTEERLREKFAEYGEVGEVPIPTDSRIGRSRGFAFVTMPDAEEGTAAIQALNGTTLDGRTLNVREAQPRGDADGPTRRR